MNLPKEVSVFRATADNFLYYFWQNTFTIFFFVTHKFLWTPPLCEVSEKGTTSFRFIQQAIDKNCSNIYREKLIM